MDPHPLEALENSLMSLSESGTEDQKKDMYLLVTKRIIGSICELPLEGWGPGCESW